MESGDIGRFESTKGGGYIRMESWSYPMAIDNAQTNSLLQYTCYLAFVKIARHQGYSGEIFGGGVFETT